MDREKRRERRAEAINEYKQLTRRVKLTNRNEDTAKIQELIRDNLTRCNELYPIVRKKLDGTAADSKHIRELVNLGHEASKRINTTSKPFELRRIIKDLMRDASDEAGKKIGKPEFYRFIAENHVNFMRTAPSFEFFYGTTIGENLVIKQRIKRTREKLVEATTVKAKEKDLNVDVEQDSTPKEVEHISKQIRRLAKDKKDGIPFFETLVDPNSFAQTVEKIFHISFLVKEGKIGVKPDRSKKPHLTYEGDTQNAASDSRQSILSFSMKDYKNWIETYEIERNCLDPAE